MARRREEDHRSDARERALILLYEAESRGADLEAVMNDQVVQPDELTRRLVSGVASHLEQLDVLVSDHAKGWTLARMPVIDRNVLRLAAFELIERPEVPLAVVIDEAVELAKRFSTDDSGRFVNGVLSAIAGVVRSPT